MKDDDLAAIEYHGIPGGSLDCQIAVERLLQYGSRIVSARILSHTNHHCLLLTNSIDDCIAVKSGFASGYGGEGPTRFSYVLQLLELFGVEIDEVEVSEEVFNRVEMGSLSMADLAQIQSTNAILPTRWHDYISERDFNLMHSGELPQRFLPIIPYGIIDPRITDLAVNFWSDPDAKLNTAYRRLEDLIRGRTQIKLSGSKLFAKVFRDDKLLTWPEFDESEKIGRANLFVSVYMALRNPRAHQEMASQSRELLSEFLVLNYLYHLESSSKAG